MANIAKEVFQGVLKVAHSILDEAGKPPVVIVQAFGKANPTPPYLAIQWPSLRQQGSPSKLSMSGDTALVQKSVSEFVGSLTMYEVGEEDYIRQIISAIEDRDCVALSDTFNLTLVSDGEIVDSPRLKGADYEHERICSFGVYVGVEHEAATQTILETVVEGVVEAKTDYDINFSLERSDP